MSSPETTRAPAAFVTTQWTQVLEARGDSSDAQAALSELCAAYYAPVFAFIRRIEPNEDAARDLTQEFFARLLARQGFKTVNPERGRFRSYLLGAVKHFLSDRRDQANSLKRGGSQALESLDSGTDTSPGLQLPDANMRSPDREFDRQWALTVLDRALARLAEEHRVAEKVDYFEALKPWLTGDSQDVSQADAARQLGINDGAVKVAIHRLRRRFRETIKAEIAQTVSNQTDEPDELQRLLAALE